LVISVSSAVVAVTVVSVVVAVVAVAVVAVAVVAVVVVVAAVFSCSYSIECNGGNLKTMKNFFLNNFAFSA